MVLLACGLDLSPRSRAFRVSRETCIKARAFPNRPSLRPLNSELASVRSHGCAQLSRRSPNLCSTYVLARCWVRLAHWVETRGGRMARWRRSFGADGPSVLVQLGLHLMGPYCLSGECLAVQYGCGSIRPRLGPFPTLNVVGIRLTRIPEHLPPHFRFPTRLADLPRSAGPLLPSASVATV
jgi:hypothetical protein